MDRSRPPSTRHLARYARAAAMGFEFVGMVAGGAFVGVYADGYFKTSPWFSMGGVLLGTVGGLYRMIQVQRYFRRNDESRAS